MRRMVAVQGRHPACDFVAAEVVAHGDQEHLIGADQAIRKSAEVVALAGVCWYDVAAAKIKDSVR